MAVVCIRQGATGSDNGVDWTNAYPSWAAYVSAGITRSDEPYVAGGTYAEEMACATATSGTTVITVKKATVSDHGTDTGWSAGYATQATFSGGLDIDTSYWEIDGQEGGFDGADMTTHLGSDHGFNFEVPPVPTPGQYPACSVAAGQSNVTFRNCRFAYTRSDYYGGAGGEAADATIYSDNFGDITSIETAVGSAVWVTTSAPHNLLSGDRVGIDDEDSTPLVPDGRLVVASISSTIFSISIPPSGVSTPGTTGKWKQVLGGEPVVDLIGTTGSHISDLLFSYCYLGTSHNSGCQAIYVDGLEFEYCAFDDIRSGSDGDGWHQSCISNRRVTDLTVKYSVIREVGGSTLFGAYNDSLVDTDGATYRADGWQIYGNVFYNRAVPGRTSSHGIGHLGGAELSLPSRNCYVVQNTFARIDTTGSGSDVRGKCNPGNWQTSSTGCVSQNNLIIDVEACTAQNNATLSHNTTRVTAVLGSEYTGTTGQQTTTDTATTWFTDIANGDLNLAQDTDARGSLGSPYDVDMFGNELTSSRGAVQYDGAPPEPEPETGDRGATTTLKAWFYH